MKNLPPPKTFVILCSDGRCSGISFSLGAPDITQLGIRVLPQIGSTIPKNMGLLIHRENAKRLFIIVHAGNDLTGCGALDAYHAIKCGGKLENPQLHKWIEENIYSSDPFMQARALAADAEAQVDTAVAIGVILLNHTAQRYHLIGERHAGVWRWVDNHAFTYDYLHGNLVGLKPTNWHLRRFLNLNRRAQKEAGALARELGFETGQSFGNLIVNATTILPQEIQEVANFIDIVGQPDPHFCVFTNPNDATYAKIQLEYALEHVAAELRREHMCCHNIVVITHTPQELEGIKLVLDKSRLFREIVNDPHWYGIYKGFVIGNHS